MVTMEIKKILSIHDIVFTVTSKNINIHLLDLTKGSCENCNYGPSGWNRTCDPK
jgi:hypothetical protein